MKFILTFFILCILSFQLHAQVHLDWANSIVNNVNNNVSLQVALDSNNNILHVGNYTTTTDFDPGTGNTNTACMGGNDGYLRKLSANGTFLWVKTFNGLSNQQCFDLCIDPFQNIYVCGSFCNTVDFDPGPGVVNKSAVLSNFEDIFILKLNPNGDFLWVKTFGGNFANNDRAFNICADHNGDVYVSGIFKDSIDFDPGPNIHTVSSTINFSNYLLKLNGNGDFLWFEHVENTSNFNNVAEITIDDLNNVYFSCAFKDSIDIDPGSNTFMLYSHGGIDGFLQKLNSNGQFLWAVNLGGVQNDFIRSLKTDHANNILLSCIYRDVMDMDPGSAVHNTALFGADDVSIIRLSSTGQYQWGVFFGGSQSDWCFGFDIDSIGNIYCTGYFGSSVDFDPGINTSLLVADGITESFIQKLDSTGHFKWVRSIGSSSYDYGYCIAIDKHHEMVGLGAYQGLADFDPDMGIYHADTNGLLNTYVLKWYDCDIDTGITANGGILTCNQNNAGYQWYQCTPFTLIPGATAQSFTPTLNGDYAAVVTQYNCSDTTSCIKVTSAGMEELLHSSSIQIIPNPMSENCLINLPFKSMEAQLCLYNAFGQTLFQTHFNGSDYTLSKRNLLKGMYYVRIVTTEGYITTGKLMIE